MLPSATSLSLEAAVGQVICPTLTGGPLLDRPYDEAAVLADLGRHAWGGYILFHAAKDIAARLHTLQAHSRVPLLIAADMERGAGQQVEGLSTFPTAMAFGAADRTDWAAALGAWTAREALANGVNWILAPVADVTNNPLNPIINIRSFGGNPQRAAAMAAAFVRGCQSQGALACAKHFPGHGDTATDSHSRLGTVTADRARLDQVELVPFRAAINAGAASLMTAHLAVPALDGTGLPATLSPAVITGLLRQTLRFEGLIVTDALLMGGITSVQDPHEAAVTALQAGCDMLLMPPDPSATFQAVLQAVHNGRLSEDRLYDAAARVLAAKARLHPPPADEPAPAAGDLARDVARAAVTLARGDAPLPRAPGLLAIAIDDGAPPESLAAWQAGLDRYGVAPGFVMAESATTADWTRLAQAAEAAQALMVGIFSPIRVSKDRSLLSAALLEPLAALMAGREAMVVSFSSPFVVTQLPQAAWWVLAYGATPWQVEATLSVVLGGESPKGHLPVTLPDHLPAAESGNPTHRRDGPSFA